MGEVWREQTGGEGVLVNIAEDGNGLVSRVGGEKGPFLFHD